MDTLELGPVGYLPEDPQILGPELESRGLSTAGTFMFQPIFDDAREDEVLDVARRTSGLVRELKGEFLILVDQPTDTRVATAGRSAAATRMEDASRRRYLERVRKIGTIAGENGLRAVFHQHAGTNVEFLDEVEALFADVARAAGVTVPDTHAIDAAAALPALPLDRIVLKPEFSRFAAAHQLGPNSPPPRMFAST